MRESKVEKYLRQQIEACGGLCEKFTSPARRGVPDRLITWPWGVMELVETKALGKKPNSEQRRDHARRARRKIVVKVLDTKEKVDEYVRTARIWDLLV